MRTLLAISILLISWCPPTTPGSDPAPASAPLFIIIGESNSGGTGAFGDVKPPSDLNAFSMAYIMNNTTYLMETLDLGTNNLIGHTGLADNSAFGFELEIARRAEAGYLLNPAYIMKSGQGGSVIAEWDTTGAYYTTFLSRYTKATQAMDSLGQAYYPVFLVTIGVNDALANTDSATYRTRFKDWIINMRDDIGADTAKVLITEMPDFNDAEADVITTIYRDLENELTHYETIDVSQAYAAGGYHWRYAGLSVIVTNALRQLGLMK